MAIPRNIGQVRDILKAFSSTDPVGGMDEEGIYFEARDGAEFRILVFRPSAVTTPRPLLVYYPGGGTVMSEAEAKFSLLRNITRTLQIICVVPGYRLDNPHGFPIGLQDAWDGLKWIAANASSFGATPTEGFIVGGASIGANFAKLLSHQARDEKLSPPLTGVFMATAFCHVLTVVLEEHKERYLSKYDAAARNSLRPDPGSTRCYNDAIAAGDNLPFYSSDNWPTGHTGLPPVYSQICGVDVSRDEALRYDRALREDGVKTKVDEYSPTSHNFWGLVSTHSASKMWQQDTIQGIAWLLEHEAKT